MNGPILFSAPAKINLYLHVTGKRADGYHLLDSLVVFTDEVADTLRLQESADFSFTVSGPFAATLERSLKDPLQNLVVKAARIAADIAGKTLSGHIHLEKNIPLGAGLGGGSSDAAATVRAFEQLWNIRFSMEQKTKLGADVPVCYTAGSCRFSGIGDILSPAPALPPLFMMLVWPDAYSSTRDVFQAMGGESTPPASIPSHFIDSADFIRFLNGMGNDLSDSAQALYPPIGLALEALRDDPACLLARMSGSGASVFGLYADDASLLAATAQMQAAHPQWWVRATKIGASKV